MQTIIPKFQLYNTDEEVIIIPDTSIVINNAQIMKISKTNQKPIFIKETPTPSIEPLPIYGLIGIHTVENNNYLIVITQQKEVTKFLQHKFYQIEKYEIISLNKETSIELLKYHKKVITTTLDIPSFYYSFTYDLTRSYQTQKSELFSSESCDNQFVWNKNLIKDFPKEYQLPIIHGFIGSSNCVIEPSTKSNVVMKRIELIIISRRSNERVGRRFFTRGADKNGNVANYVETEQIVTIGDKHSSYVQFRGSIPVMWSQVPCIKYMPKIAINENDNDNFSVFSKHFKNMKEKYGPVTCISLIDMKGREKELGDKYEEMTKKLNDSDVKLERVDFHKLMKNIPELFAFMDKIYEANEFKSCEFNGNEMTQKQNGIFRVNCVDNLDRTNVCESVFGRLTAEEFMKKKEIGLLGENDKIIDNKQLNSMFVNLWADNGNQMSNEYTGTNALKNDITRTGKRMKSGYYYDGKYSIMRYVINNFFDGETVDNMNVFLGNCKGKCVDYSFDLQRKGIFYGFGLFMILALFSLVMLLFTFNGKYLLNGLIYAALGIGLFMIAIKQGKAATLPPQLMEYADYQKVVKEKKE